MPYQCLKQQVFEDGLYKIVPIRQEDMGSIREWRNDQIAILRQDKPLTNEDQSRYWQTVLEPSLKSERPKQILFSFLKNEVLIGYGGLTHIDWDAGRGEVSFLLETLRANNSSDYKEEFTRFLGLLKVATFSVLKFHRMFAETFDLRPAHIATLEASGFIYEGRLKDHVKIDGKYYDSLIHGMIQNATIQ